MKELEVNGYGMEDMSRYKRMCMCVLCSRVEGQVQKLYEEGTKKKDDKVSLDHSTVQYNMCLCIPSPC